MRRRLIGLSVVSALSAMILAMVSDARAEVIERVVAVVNDDAIFLSDVRQKAAPYLPRLADVPPMQQQAALDQLYRQIVERLVDDHLIHQAGEEMDISVSRAEVDRAVDRVRTNAGLDETQFWRAVEQQGMSPTQYREDLRSQLFRLKVLNQRARARVNITEEEVRRRYDEGVRRARRQLTFETSHIFFPLPAGVGAAELARVMREAQEVRDSVSSEDEFRAQMAARAGGDLGVLSQGSLPAELEEALLGLEVGQIGQPVRGPAGVHIFLLSDRQEAAASIPPYEQVRMELYQSMMEQAMARQEELFLRELRTRATIDVRL